MVTQQTLADVLIEAGFEPEAARRAGEMIEQDLSDLARRSEVNLRFDQMDERFIAQDRAIEARFDGIDRQFEGIDRQFDGVNKQFDGVNKQLGTLDTRITDLRTEFMEHLQVLKESMDRRFSVFTWALGLVFAALLAVFGALIAVLIELFSRGP